MEKSKFLELVKQRQTGERARVLWEILTEIIGFSPEGTRVEFWQKIKEAYEGEMKATEEMMRIPDKKPRKSRKMPDNQAETTALD